MNKKILLVAGATLITTGLYSATSIAATVTANASATVLAPLDITLGTNAMDFGDVSGDADVTSSVVLATDGTTTAAGGANAGGTSTAGDFNVSGAGNLAYTISLPTSTLLTGSGGADMTVDTFVDSAGGTSNLVTGSDSFAVGATLNINANQGAGNYTGTYDITVNYQ